MASVNNRRKSDGSSASTSTCTPSPSSISSSVSVYPKLIRNVSRLRVFRLRRVARQVVFDALLRRQSDPIFAVAVEVGDALPGAGMTAFAAVIFRHGGRVAVAKFVIHPAVGAVHKVLQDRPAGRVVIPGVQQDRRPIITQYPAGDLVDEGLAALPAEREDRQAHAMCRTSRTTG